MVDYIEATNALLSGTPADATKKVVDTAKDVADATKDVVEKSGEALQEGSKFLGSKVLGGVKDGAVKNVQSGWKGKAQVGLGILLVGDGLRRAISNAGAMISGNPGLDKEGEPLPSPTIAHLACNVGEAALGLFVMSRTSGKASPTLSV